MGLRNNRIIPSQIEYISVYLNGNIVPELNINNQKQINVVSILSDKYEFIRDFTLGSILSVRSFSIKERIHDALLYDRILTEEEIKHNYKASLQYNGEDIDGKAG